LPAGARRGKQQRNDSHRRAMCAAEYCCRD
jgi:hypothetical protein